MPTTLLAPSHTKDTTYSSYRSGATPPRSVLIFNRCLQCSRLVRWRYVQRSYVLDHPALTLSLSPALVADSSKINYIMFTGISSMFITLTFIVTYVFDWENHAIELFTNLLWWVFWLTAAIVTTTDNFSSRVEASCAFSWMTWIFWNASCLQSFIAYRRSKSSVGR